MKSLLDSRKFWLAVVGSVCTTVIVVVCLVLKVPEASMLAMAGSISALLFKLIDGIAREDAAKVAPPTLAQAGGTIINNQSVPPPGPLGAEGRTPPDGIARTMDRSFTTEPDDE